MRYGSVCSGIEAATVAWHGLGWEAAFFSEIEAFPRAVLEHHYPEVTLYGDFTKIDARIAPSIDLLVGGTPCQSFSVAGLRKGMDDPRGNLALGYLRLADRMRPRWVVWENVPGVLSSSGGRDFGAFLGALGELGYGWAYRVLDAQYFGVPQRRRRVFVVGYLGDWRPAVSVLFESHCMQGHPAPSREARKGTPHGVAGGPGGSRGEGRSPGKAQEVRQEEVVGSLAASAGPRSHGFSMFNNNQSVDAGHVIPACEVAPSMSASGPPYSRTGQQTVESDALVAEVRRVGSDLGDDVGDVGERPALIHMSSECANAEINVDKAGTLMTHNSQRGGILAGPLVAGCDLSQRAEAIGFNEETAGTVAPGTHAGHGNHVVMGFSGRDDGGDAGEDVSPTIRSCHDEKYGRSSGWSAAVAFEPGSVARNAGPAGLSDQAPTLRSDMGDNQPAVLGFSRTDDGGDAGDDVFPTLRSCNKKGSQDGPGHAAVCYGIDEEHNAEEDGFGCLKAREKGGGFEGTVCYGLDEENNADKDGFGCLKSTTRGSTPGAVCFSDPRRHDDRHRGGPREMPCLNRDNNDIVVTGFMDTESHSSGNNDDIAPTMRTGDCAKPAVAIQYHGDRKNPGVSTGDDVAFTVPANPMSDRQQSVNFKMQVRRLTPVECERLQGFPDDYTAIPWKGRGSDKCPDGPRYKALGNSMAVPVMRWIGQRIADVDARLSADAARKAVRKGALKRGAKKVGRKTGGKRTKRG